MNFLKKTLFFVVLGTLMSSVIVAAKREKNHPAGVDSNPKAAATSAPSAPATAAIDKLPLDMLQNIFSYLLSPIDENGFLVTYVSPRNQEVVNPKVQAVCKKWRDIDITLDNSAHISSASASNDARGRIHPVLFELNKSIPPSLPLFKLPEPKADAKNPLLEFKSPLLTALCQHGSIDIEVLWPVLMRLPDAAKILLMQSIISNPENKAPENKTAITVRGTLGNTILHVSQRLIDDFQRRDKNTEAVCIAQMVDTIERAVQTRLWTGGAGTMFQDEKHFVLADWTSVDICRQKIKKYQQKNPDYRMRGLYNNAGYAPCPCGYAGPLDSFVRRFFNNDNFAQNHLNMLHALFLEGALASERYGFFTVLGQFCSKLKEDNQKTHLLLAIQLFIDNKASLNAKDYWGSSALHVLCKHANSENKAATLLAIQALILAGANPDNRDNTNCRPIDLVKDSALKPEVAQTMATARAQFLARASSSAQAGKQGPVTKNDKAAEK